MFSPILAYLKIAAVCPHCRRFQILGQTINLVRTQTTSTKTSTLRRLQAKKPKKKHKGEQLSEIIHVTDSPAINVKETTAVIKKSSTHDLMKSVGIDLGMVPRKNNDSALSIKKNSVNLKKNNIKVYKQSQTVDDKSLLSVNSSSSKSLISNNIYKMSHEDVIDLTPTESMVELSEDSFRPKTPDSVNVIEGIATQQRSLSDAEVKDVISDINEMCDERPNCTTRKTTSKNVKLKSKKLKIEREDLKKLYKVKQKELQKSSTDFYLNTLLRAFLDVCINSNLINLAHSTLLCYRVKGKMLQDSPKVADTKLYNIVLGAQAQARNWAKVKELLFVMREDKIPCNLQTYAACFECISYLSSKNKNTINNLLSDLQKDGLDINNLDIECTFTNDQRERIIEVIREVNPEFSPKPREHIKGYTCELLSSINTTLPEDRHYFPSGGTVDYEDLLSNLKLQLKSEITNEVEIKSIETGHLDEKIQRMRYLVQECEESWRNALYELFERQIKSISSQQGTKFGKVVTLQPFLSALQTQDFVDLMLKEIQTLAESSETFSLPLSVLQCNLGTKVMNRYLTHTKQQQGITSKLERLYEKYCDYYTNPRLISRYTSREYWEKLIRENPEGPTIETEDHGWPRCIIGGIGKFLYDLIIKEIKINTNLLRSGSSPGYNIPAFYCVYRNIGIHVTEEIKPHPILSQLYKVEHRETLRFESTVIPMMVPPLPWTSIRSGGYLLSSTKLIRFPEIAVQHKLNLERTPNQQLYPVYDSLNQLGECPWKINKPILDIVIEVFNSKGDESLDIPPPASESPPLPALHMTMTKEERARVYFERAQLKRKRAETYSLRCDCLYKLSIANHLRDQIFWFPHNLDFRGRVYPCPPHFNHLGGDMARSILLFAKGEPLGDKGLDWLKIHLINLTGTKKQEPVSRRLEYANEMMTEIVNSAKYPLTGNRWWTKSDEPWQTLACCMEIVKALESPDPVRHICYFPIHQDGSCNGLQHYAALGRDESGAREVNLHPMDTPQDVYSGVASLLEKERSKDAANGDVTAKLLEGFVKRKVIKQTVMTTVYGVTRHGAHLQILKQLKDLPDFPQDKCWIAASYLAHKTFQSLQQMFTATKEIQDWFTEIARLISQVCGQPVEWVTPLGLPVIQPYHRPNKDMTIMKIGDKNHTKHLSKVDVSLKPNVMKQKNAFPPNFIHSLDSTHMMLTSLFCHREGITFVSVHDCYWTHPSTVSIMNRICREQFVALHSQPILENLSKFLIEKYSYSDKDFRNDGSPVDMSKRRLNKVLGRVPTRGAFNLENVLNSVYFFS